MADGSDLKITEYDFPKPLLEKANVQTIESADQPTYNDDLAKVTSQALNHEESQRKAADNAEAGARSSEDASIRRDLTNFQVNAVTKPNVDGSPTANMLDTDMFESVEVNGETGVAMKANGITNEYLANDSVTERNTNHLMVDLADSTYNFDYEAGDRLSAGVYVTVDNVLKLVRVYTKDGNSHQISLWNVPRAALAKNVLPYSQVVNSFTYQTPTAGVSRITELYNLIDFGTLQLIVASASVTMTAAGNAFMTVNTGKVWSDRYGGTTTNPPSSLRLFLVAESPENPTSVTSGLVYDQSNGYRVQMHANAAGTFRCTYLLGNIVTQRLISWGSEANAKENTWYDE